MFPNRHSKRMRLDKSLDDIVFMGYREVERRSLRNGC